MSLKKPTIISFFTVFSFQAIAMEASTLEAEKLNPIQIFQSPSYKEILETIKQRVSNKEEDFGYQGQGFSIRFDMNLGGRIFNAMIDPGHLAFQLRDLSEDKFEEFAKDFFDIDSGVATFWSSWNHDLKSFDEYLSLISLSYHLKDTCDGHVSIYIPKEERTFYREESNPYSIEKNRGSEIHYFLPPENLYLRFNRVPCLKQICLSLIKKIHESDPSKNEEFSSKLPKELYELLLEKQSKKEDSEDDIVEVDDIMDGWDSED